jgi:uncharacterized protein YcbX
VEVTLPAFRCAIPTRPQDGLPADPSVLRTIVRETGQNLGVYAVVRAPGAVRVGDPVALE